MGLNFTISELIKSDVANANKINNIPQQAYIYDNLLNLIIFCLQPLREKIGKPIIISSGYRCDKLNKLVGGVSNSDHRFGAAADIHTKSDKPDDNKTLFDTICMLAKAGRIECRQIINEYNYNWIHISVNNKHNSTKKNQILHIK